MTVIAILVDLKLVFNGFQAQPTLNLFGGILAFIHIKTHHLSKRLMTPKKKEGIGPFFLNMLQLLYR